MAVYALGDLVPDIDPDAYVHPEATVIGAVVLGAEATVWPHAVIRADYGRIVVGARTSIQDGTVLHVPGDGLETTIGSDCVVGHLAHLEGCTVEDDVLIGSGSVVLHRVVVRRWSIVGANAVVPNDMEVPSGAMALGVPARIREGAVAPGTTARAVARYVDNGRRYAKELRRLS